MIAIITAIADEAQAVTEHLELKPSEYANMWESEDIILLEVGVGKVLSAIQVTQLLERKNTITHIINIGVVGGIDPDLNVGDVLLGNQAFEHDAYIPAEIDEGVSYPEMPLLFPEALNTPTGIVATGDQFVDDENTKKRLQQKGVAVVDMECAAIAKVARMYNIPLIAIKGVSDSANPDAPSDFEANVRLAITNTLPVLSNTLKDLLGKK